MKTARRVKLPLKRENSINRIQQSGLGALLRLHRNKSTLTQLQLAKLAGVGKTVVFDIEAGKKSVRLDTLLKVLRVLGITLILESRLGHVLEVHDEVG